MPVRLDAFNIKVCAQGHAFQPYIDRIAEGMSTTICVPRLLDWSQRVMLRRSLQATTEGVAPWPALLHVRTDALTAAVERATAPLSSTTTVFLGEAASDGTRLVYGMVCCSRLLANSSTHACLLDR